MGLVKIATDEFEYGPPEEGSKSFGKAMAASKKPGVWIHTLSIRRNGEVYLIGECVTEGLELHQPFPRREPYRVEILVTDCDDVSLQPPSFHRRNFFDWWTSIVAPSPQWVKVDILVGTGGVVETSHSTPFDAGRQNLSTSDVVPFITNGDVVWRDDGLVPPLMKAERIRLVLDDGFA